MTQHFKLNYVLVLLSVAISGLTLSEYVEKDISIDDTDTLILAHVVFRHGDKTPELYNLWNGNPYYDESYYEPYGYGQLTNDGKRREYNLGKELRTRYGTFLGDSWNTKIYDLWSTHYNRTKMSAALVLAGLFPPTGSLVWADDLPWQPIPYNYLPAAEDRELSSWACPTVLPLIYNDENNTIRLSAYDGLIETLSNGIGEDLDYLGALDLYPAMLIQTQLGLPLQTWTQEVFPEPLRTYIVDFYYIETSTNELKTVIAGYLLKKILKDTVDKINGTLSPQERKIFLYAGHEINIAIILTSLEAFNMVNLPPYGSYISFEVHSINEIYGIKLYYQDYETSAPRLLTLPGCEEFCPIDQFISLTAHIIPKSDAECLGE